MCVCSGIYITREEEKEEEETWIDNGEDLNRPHIFKELLLLLGIYAAAVVKEPHIYYFSATATATTTTIADGRKLWSSANI